MFHPNISSTGHICLELFNRDWCPQMSVEKILLSISSILDAPLMDHPANKKAAQCFRKDPHHYDCIVREYTRQYAHESSLNTENELEVSPTHSYVDVIVVLSVLCLALLFGIIFTVCLFFSERFNFNLSFCSEHPFTFSQ